MNDFYDWIMAAQCILAVTLIVLCDVALAVGAVDLLR
jgi:hypothetical protein